MRRDEIRAHLVEAGYDARLTEGGAGIEVEFRAGGRNVSLVHEFPDQLVALPKFGLVEATGFGTLAHVTENPKSGLGDVCIADADSISVNTDVPELAYEAAVARHVGLVTRLIEEPAHNRDELLREFQSNWEILCVRSGEDADDLFVVMDKPGVESLQVRGPKGKSGVALRDKHLALADDVVTSERLEAVRGCADWRSRSPVGKGVLLQLNGVEPAPTAPEELKPWYFAMLRRVDSSGRGTLDRLRKQPGKNFWLVFSTAIPDGETLFAIRFRSGRKGSLPESEEEAQGWSLTPHNVRSLSREALVPRGGGVAALAEKSVLLVGCGSVGSELAERLTSVGVGRLTIADPDRFAEQNLYRHTLSLRDLGRPKSLGVLMNSQLRHPWAEVSWSDRRLEDFVDPRILACFDLIVAAIGAPTVERVFADRLRERGINVPVINCWVEAYGVGGHATLGIPGKKGCWHCAYVDPETSGRGLASNLNFLAPNQDVTRTHGGCGVQFLPYTGIAASYTATMTADLAMRFLMGDVTEPSRISWKGSAADAERAGFRVTYRYRHFDESLRVLPLHNKDCDLCGG